MDRTAGSGSDSGSGRGDRVAGLSPLFSQLVRLETELWDAVDRRLRTDHDLMLTWFEPMQIIARSGGCRVNDIADELRTTVGGTSKLVDRIEAAGLGRRRPNPDDRRSSIVELTPAGRRVVTAATKTFEAELDRLLGATLSPPQADDLTDLLTALRTALAADPGARRAR